MPLGVGWQGRQLHTHIHTPPTVVHSSPSCTLPWSVYTLTTQFGLLASHAQALGDFSLTQTFSGAPRVAEAPTHCNSRPCCCFVHPREKSELFSPHVGPLLLCILTQRDSLPFSIFTHGILLDLSTQYFLGQIVNRVAVSFTHRLIRGFYSHIGWENCKFVPIAFCLLFCCWGCVIRFSLFEL